MILLLYNIKLSGKRYSKPQLLKSEQKCSNSHEQILTRHFFKFTLWIHSISFARVSLSLELFATFSITWGLVLFLFSSYVSSNMVCTLKKYNLNIKQRKKKKTQNSKLVDGCVCHPPPSFYVNLFEQQTTEQSKLISSEFMIAIERAKFTANCTDPVIQLLVKFMVTVVSSESTMFYQIHSLDDIIMLVSTRHLFFFFFD